MMMIILLTFIYPDWLKVCVHLHHLPAYINSAFTHIYIWITHQLLKNCWELSDLHKGTLIIAIKQRKHMCRRETTFSYAK